MSLARLWDIHAPHTKCTKMNCVFYTSHEQWEIEIEKTISFPIASKICHS